MSMKSPVNLGFLKCKAGEERAPSQDGQNEDRAVHSPQGICELPFSVRKAAVLDLRTGLRTVSA